MPELRTIITSQIFLLTVMWVERSCHADCSQQCLCDQRSEMSELSTEGLLTGTLRSRFLQIGITIV